MRRRFGSSRRVPSLAALGAIGAATLALAAATSACSGAGSNRPTAAGATTATPTDSAQSAPSSTAPTGATLGTIDTNPADPPVLNPTLAPGRPVPPGFRGEPAGLTPPASWDPAGWLEQVHAAAGPAAVANDSQDPNLVVTAWKWSAAGVTSLEAGVNSDGQHHPKQASCSAQGFNPADSAAAAKISSTLELCASTGLSGASAEAARAWIGQQIDPVLSELRSAAKGRQSVSSSPAFGGATYQVQGRSEFQYGYLIQVLVW